VISLDDALPQPNDTDPALLKLSAAVPLLPFMAAQGFDRAPHVLPDGTLFFRRDRNHLAVAFDRSGVPQFKVLPEATWKAIDISSPGRPASFEAVPGAAVPLHRFASALAPIEEPALRRELAAWSAWSQEPGLGPLRGIAHRHQLQAPEAALELDSRIRERTFASHPPATTANLDVVGISPATLEAAPFRRLLRSDPEGILALAADGNGISAIARTALAAPGRSVIAAGDEAGIWMSDRSAGPVSKLIITQTPLTAMAHYQQHRDDSVRYVAIGGDLLTDGQKETLKTEIDRTLAARGRGDKPLELAVTCHHRAHGLKLYSSIETLFRPNDRLQITGQLPDNTLGRDWIELAKSTSHPELRVDLPAYAASRLGLQELYRSPDNAKVLMASEPAGQGAKLLFSRQQDGSWRYENDKDHPNDRGSAADFARTRLDLALNDFRGDLVRFDREQELRRTPALRADTLELNQKGIRPETIDDPCFRGTLRREGNSLLYAHQDVAGGRRGLESIRRSSLTEPAALAHNAAGEAGLWFSNPPPRTKSIVIVASPLEALAYHQQNRTTDVQYIASSSQTLSPRQAQELASYAHSLAHRGLKPEIIVATSRGQAGAEHARSVREALATPSPGHTVRAHAPTVADDWITSAARRERAFVRQLPRDNARSAGHGF
jgi:hypothetical protein